MGIGMDAIGGRLTERYVFFGLAALALLMFSIDMSIVAVALPTMTRELDAPIGLVGWTITAYGLAQIVVMPLVGKLSEQFGRMRVFLICVAIFTLGSLLCGLAPNIYALIAFRVLQAIGGGGFLPSATGIVANEFPESRGKMIGLFASIFPIGGIIGPNLGGAIVEYLSWRDVFLVNVPIGVLVVALLVRQARRSETIVRRSIDAAGALLFAGMMLCLMLALTWIGQDVAFWRTPTCWLLFAGAVVLCGLFVRQERRAPESMLDLELVVKHPFSTVNAFSFLFGACVFGIFTFIPYYGWLQYGMGPLETGAALTPRSLLMIAFSTVTSLFLLKLGYRALMVGGLVLIASSLWLLSLGIRTLELGPIQVNAFWLLAAQVAVAGVGMGVFMPAANNAGIDLLPERTALITAIRAMFRSTGGVIGTALILVIIELSEDKAAGLRTVFGVLAVMVLATIPLAMLIPDRARERRVAARADEVRDVEPSGLDGRTEPTTTPALAGGPATRTARH